AGRGLVRAPRHHEGGCSGEGGEADAPGSKGPSVHGHIPFRVVGPAAGTRAAANEGRPSGSGDPGSLPTEAECRQRRANPADPEPNPVEPEPNPVEPRARVLGRPDLSSDACAALRLGSRSWSSRTNTTSLRW